MMNQDINYSHSNSQQISFNGVTSTAGSKLSGDDSSLDPGDELANGEVLHCLFPGCMKGFYLFI
jgi:hypothetical protein